MKLIKTIFIFIPVVAAMILLTPFGVIVFIGSLIGLRKPVARMMYRIAQGWALMMITFTGCKMTVTGREHIPKKGGVCFVSNHGSIFDIVLHLAYDGRPIGFIAKKELAYIPFLNMWIHLLGGLFIDRKNIRRAVKTINRGIARIKAGGAMIIFPEGHRSRGQGLLPFRPGALKLATQSGAPIVPVALAGSYDVFERQYRLQPGPVGVHFGEPIFTASLPAEGRKNALADQVYEVIKGALG
ncbi:MAG: 1-acyl-sn-glycerol-3-phosphate acyltransferase [Treponema sp.]|nr:1-acyl-sn-glycerol-3-phosphate acyltransferase [Treponema sp.]